MASGSSKDNDGFFVFLAIVSFIADVYTLYQFVIEKTILEFWTFQWIISIIFVALLAVGGFLFLNMAGREDASDIILFAFGIFYSLFSIAAYLYWGFQQVDDGVRFGDYLGFLVLFIILCGVGVFGVGHDDSASYRLPSYGYATANLAFVFLLIRKYVLQGSPFQFWTFSGEILILVIGIVLFVGLYTLSES